MGLKPRTKEVTFAGHKESPLFLFLARFYWPAVTFKIRN